MEELLNQLFNPILEAIDSLNTMIGNITVWLLVITIITIISLVFNVTLTMRIKGIQEAIAKMEKE